MKYFEKLKALRQIALAAAVALVASLGVAGLLASPVLALQQDQTRIFNSRSANQKLTYYRVTINFNDQNIGSAQQFGALPANAYIFAIDAYVTTAFNAGTTNVVTIGTTKASSNEIVASGITAGTTGVYHLTYVIPPPALLRHVDKATGIPDWWKPITAEWTFNYPSKNK